ncbi:MAG TPA: type IV pili twitching motility protein PilT, partial [Phycisphaerales bacterium]|nr:type IV pili twitching motility protein PilT [Phycisphaerales bacterium]
MNLLDILKTAHEADASDIHLISGHAPMVRVHQVIQPLEFPVITAEQCRAFVEQMASKEAFAKYESIKDSDFSFAAPGLARYRVNAHVQRGTAAIAMRAIKTKVPPLAQLNLPEVIT